MSLKVVVFLALLAVAFAEKPYVGLRMPHLPLTPISSQIIGGKEAPPHAYPYIVAITWTNATLQAFCGGSILNDRWILTAGHCVDKLSDDGIHLVRAGKHNIDKYENTEQSVRVERVFLHEKYTDYPFLKYDIALIKLESPLYFTNEIQPIKLAKPESDPTGNATLCGWGRTNGYDPQLPSKLQHIQLPYVDRVTCHDVLLCMTGESVIDEKNVCTGPLNEGKSACRGDSGGPLTSGSGQNRVVTGIVSFGSRYCDIVELPNVYTRVSKFNSWIEEKMRLY